MRYFLQIRTCEDSKEQCLWESAGVKKIFGVLAEGILLAIISIHG